MAPIKDIMREWWKQILGVLITAVLLFNMSADAAKTQNRLEEVALETHTALCALHDDIDRRREAAQDFLDRHPQGIEGISREDIKRSLESQRSTLRALSVLDCSPNGI